MKSGPLGKSTSEAEVTNISRHGLWLLVHDEELFLPFEEFPWFKDASVQVGAERAKAGRGTPSLASTGCGLNIRLD